MTHGAFQRVIVACSGSQVDCALLDYAALFSGEEERAEVLVAATPADPVLHALGPAARAIFQRRGSRAVTFQPILEADLDSVLAMARRFQADVLVVRHPRHFTDASAFAGRLLSEAPCSVCFVPHGSLPRVRRVVAGIDLDSQGAAVLARASSVCANLGAEELVAVHACRLETWVESPQNTERFRHEKMLELYRFMARARLGGVNCTPVLEADSTFPQALLRAAMRDSADLLIIGQSPTRHIRLLSPPREAGALLSECRLPLLHLRTGGRKPSLLTFLRKRVFSQPEPSFN
jgi:nucleotide-binding universal stress UspA family protein